MLLYWNPEDTVWDQKYLFEVMFKIYKEATIAEQDVNGCRLKDKNQISEEVWMMDGPYPKMGIRFQNKAGLERNQDTWPHTK